MCLFLNKMVLISVIFVNFGDESGVLVRLRGMIDNMIFELNFKGC